MIKYLVAMLLVVFSVIAVSAQQEDAEETSEPTVRVLNCVDGEGCTARESNLTQEEAAIVLGTQPPASETELFVVCVAAGACTWSHLTPEELEILFDGDGVVEEIETETPEDAADAEASSDPEAATGSETEVLPIFTEEELAELPDALCPEGDCRIIPLFEGEFDTLFGDGQEAIQPEDGQWEISITAVDSTCPGGAPNVMQSAVVDVTFSDPFVVQDVMDLSGIEAASVSYNNNPNSNLYVASVSFGGGADVYVEYAYRVVSTSQIRGSFYIDLSALVNCFASGSFELVRISD